MHPKIAIFRMCYGENGTVNVFETLADNVFKHNYSMNQIKKKWNDGNIFRVTQVYTLKWYFNDIRDYKGVQSIFGLFLQLNKIEKKQPSSRVEKNIC